MIGTVIRQSQAEIKFETYRYYLQCISDSCDDLFPNLTSLVSAATGAVSHFAQFPDPDTAFLASQLALAWNTECLLNAGPDDIHLLRISNQWTPIQAYYAVYSAAEAVAYLTDGVKSRSHQKTLRKVTEILSRLSLHPWHLAFRGPRGKTGADAKRLNFPPVLVIPNNLQRRGVEPIQMIARCLKAEHSHRVDDLWTRKSRVLKYKFDPGITGLLHFIYRLRIKSTYKEVEPFITSAPDHYIRDFALTLRRFTQSTLVLFEVIIQRKCGRQAFRQLASGYLQQNEYASSLASRLEVYGT